MLARVERMLQRSNRWRGVEIAGWTAFLLMTASVVAFTYATKTSTSGTDIPALLYPCLAAGSVFGATCLWILAAANIGIPEDLLSEDCLLTAKRWFWFTFMMVAVALLFYGWAGDQGLKAARSLNWFLFGSLDDPLQEDTWSGRMGLPYTLLAVIGNALALATLTYLGALCNGLILGACDDKTGPPENMAVVAFRAGEAERRLKSFLVMASALMVTSTLTFYLSFATVTQVQVLQHALVQRLQPTEQPLSSEKRTPASSFVLDCRATTTTPIGQNCMLSVLAAAEKAPTPASSAAYLALVAGLSFTGVLFILFTACGGALSDRIAELARRHLEQAVDDVPFNLKEWRERSGLADSGIGAQAIQGLALVAPALTGLLTLVNS